MQQQVNFLQSRFREQTTVLPSTLLLQVCGAFFVAMILIYAFAANRVGSVAGDLRVISAQEAAALERLENLRGTIHDVMGEQSWAQKLNEASELLREKEASLALIEGPDLGNTAGFSSHLRALARQGFDGLWLTHISLSARGEKTWLQGESMQAGFVPVYLQSLADEPAFAEQRFFRLIIDRGVDDADDTVTFVVSSDSSLGSKALVGR